jgi:RNA polymerase sigma-70 factor (ECF subfamily)
LTIATRLAIDELRRRGRTELIDVDEVELSSPERTDRQAEDRSLGHAIRAAVGSLPPEYRAVFILRAYHDLDYREIATTLECDLGTVKSRLARARARLREQLEGDGHG